MGDSERILQAHLLSTGEGDQRGTSELLHEIETNIETGAGYLQRLSKELRRVQKEANGILTKIVEASKAGGDKKENEPAEGLEEDSVTDDEEEDKSGLSQSKRVRQR